jgi:hypothetical protein
LHFVKHLVVAHTLLYSRAATLQEGSRETNKAEVMKKLAATLSTLTLALVSLFNTGATQAQQPPVNVQGNWTIYSMSIRDGSIVIKHVQIAQYGNHITGYFEGPDQAGPIQGEVKGKKLVRFGWQLDLHFGK